MTLPERGKKAELELLSRGPAGAGHHELHPPAGAARARPRGLVRARTGRPRAVRAAAARRAGAARARLPCADDRRRAAGLGANANIIAVEEVPADRVAHVRRRRRRRAPRARCSRSPRWSRSRRAAEAPSNLIITGRYILQPEIFDMLAKQERGAGGEIQLTDAMIALARTQPFYGLKFDGRSFDCGSKIGFLAANVAYALARDDIAPGVARRDRAACSARNNASALQPHAEQEDVRRVVVARLTFERSQSCRIRL